GLSRAAMETLSVICYNQPVTRAGIEYVRGVNSDGVLVRLIEKGIVEECGRSDAPGRPILYGTTVKFLQAMGVEKLSQLPQVTRIVINEEAPSEKFGADGAGQPDENTNEAEP
ncbi:MAG: SMC-Scp complex subunit ScpB, partial [Clostridia bacterium]|nr:SMC-Scp complex subunit ScpB [Clostridia bacterium]